MGTSVEAAVRNGVQLVASQSDRLQRGYKRPRKGSAVGASLGLLPEMRCAQWQPNVVSYSAPMSAREKDQQWPQAWTLLP